MNDETSTEPIPVLPPEAVRTLHDASKRVAYALAMETADELRREPAQLIARAREWRRRFPLTYEPDRLMWDALLDGPVEELCRALLRLDDRGELLRDTMPSFGAVSERRRMAIAKAAYRAAQP